MQYSLPLGAKPQKYIGTKVTFALVFFFFLPLFLAFFIVLAPGLSLFLLRYIALIAFVLLVFKLTAGKGPWAVRLAFSAILGQAILNYGFSNIAIGPITFAEGAIALSLLFILPRCWSSISKIPLFWIAILAIAIPAISHLPFDLRKYGMPALRDFLSPADIIYFIAGLAVCCLGLKLNLWEDWRKRFLQFLVFGGFIYTLLTPFAKQVSNLSPVFSSYQQPVPVFGTFVTGPINVLGAILSISLLPEIFPKRKTFRTLLSILMVLLCGAGLLALQSRGFLGAVFVTLVALLLSGRTATVRNWLIGVACFIFALWMIDAYDITIEGRVSNIGLKTLVNRVASVTGKHGEEAGRRGVEQRQKWWEQSLGHWSESPSSIVIGAGYGLPLTDFSSAGTETGKGVLVREPHNSYISSLTRGGIIYLALWGMIIFIPITKAIQTLRRKDLETDDDNKLGRSLWVFCILFSLLLISINEPTFETPSLAAIYYFIAGWYSAESSNSKDDSKKKSH
jgi:hypothetical protein